MLRRLLIIPLLLAALSGAVFAAMPAAAADESAASAAANLAPARPSNDDLMGLGTLPDPSGWEQAGFEVVDRNATGQTIFRSLVQALLNTGKMLLTIAAVAFGSFIGFRMVFTEASSDDYAAQWRQFSYLLFGLFLLHAPNVLVAFDPSYVYAQSSDLQSKTSCGGVATDAVIFYSSGSLECYVLNQILIPLQGFLAVLAVFFILLSGYRMVANAGNDGAVETAKGNIQAALLGLVVVASSTSIQYLVTTTNVVFGARFVGGLIGFAVSLLGPIGVLIFIVAGAMYATAGQDESRAETALSWMKGTAIGLVIIFSAYVIAGEFAPDSLADINLR